MIELKLIISGETATEALAELRHLAAALNPSEDFAKAPAPVAVVPPTAEEAPKRTRKKQTQTPATTVPPTSEEEAQTPAPSVQGGAPVSEVAPAAPAFMQGAATTPPAAPVPFPTPAAPAPAPAPVTPPPQPVKVYTLDDISRAGSALIDQGKMDAIMALMGKYGVEAITQLQEANYPAFVEDLRALGATI